MSDTDTLTSAEADAFRQRCREFLQQHATGISSAARGDDRGASMMAAAKKFQQALASAGLAGMVYDSQYGGAGLSRAHERIWREEYANFPDMTSELTISHGMCLPVLNQFGTEAQKKQFLADNIAARTVWCQMFSEPGAGSDVASLQTKAERDGDEWVINGQKVWTSLAHKARWGLLLARTNPDAPKHKGLTYFVLDMHAPGVECRPLRQMTGQAEFNEVYITDARIPDAHRLGGVGDGWRVAMTTLMNERSALGASGSRRGGGAIADAVDLWAARPDLHTPVLRDRLTQLWLRAEAQRLTSERSRASATVGGPGPEASIGKMVGAELNQKIYEFCMDLLGPEGILYHSYAMYGQNAGTGDWRGPLQQRYLRSRANTIEGGTSEVMRNILGERVLGLPGDLRADAGMPWKEVPRG